MLKTTCASLVRCSRPNKTFVNNKFVSSSVMPTCTSIIRFNHTSSSSSQQQPSSRIRSSSVQPKEESSNISFQRTYIHKISQIILEHFQNHHHEWIQNEGLDRGLRLHANGTFTLHYPPTTNSMGYNTSGRIWTSYDAGTKQHWISVYHHKLRLKFLVKEATYIEPGVDNVYPKFTTFKAALIEADKVNNQIRNVVDQLVQTINESKNSIATNTNTSTKITNNDGNER